MVWTWKNLNFLYPNHFPLPYLFHTLILVLYREWADTSIAAIKSHSVSKKTKPAKTKQDGDKRVKYVAGMGLDLKNINPCSKWKQ